MSGRNIGAALDRPVMAPVLHRMASLGPITDAQRVRIDAIGRRVDTHEPKAVLLNPDDAVGRPRYMLAGWACRQRLLPDGRRQIFGLLLPGDGIGVCLPPRPLAMSTTVALTRVKTADAAELLTPGALTECPELGETHARAAARDEGLLLDHVVRLGRQTAFERVAHLLLELYVRLETVGLAENGSFELPLTQEILGDVLGLSVVHVNRTLQQLRRERLVALGAGRMTLLEPEQLASIADFSASQIAEAPRRVERSATLDRSTWGGAQSVA